MSTYKQAGVDIDAGEALVERIKPMVASTPSMHCKTRAVTLSADSVPYRRLGIPIRPCAAFAAFATSENR